MLAALRALGGLIAALLLHLVLVATVPEAAGIVDPFLILVVFLALDGNVLLAVLAGTVVGLTEDAVTNGLFGVYGSASTVVAYVVARAAQLMSLDRQRFIALLFGLSAVLQQIVVLLLMVVLSTEMELPTLPLIALRIVVSGLLGTVLASLGARAGRRYRVWKQERQPRVRL